MGPSILARVRFRTRSRDLAGIDWDADGVEAPRPQRRATRRQVTDTFLARLDAESAEEAIEGVVRDIHRDLDPQTQERRVRSFLRRRARLLARNAKAALTPRVSAVKVAQAPRKSSA